MVDVGLSDDSLVELVPSLCSRSDLGSNGLLVDLPFNVLCVGIVNLSVPRECVLLGSFLSVRLVLLQEPLVWGPSDGLVRRTRLTLLFAPGRTSGCLVRSVG